MLRGSDDLGAVDGKEIDGLLAVGLLIDPDMLGIAAACWGAPCYCCQQWAYSLCENGAIGRASDDGCSRGIFLVVCGRN